MYLTVKTKKHSYILNLERRNSLLQGDSGTGKSKLVRYIDNFNKYGKGAGLVVECDKRVTVVSEAPRSKYWFDEHADELLVIDEDVRFPDRGEFFKSARSHDCWVLYVSRCYDVTAFDCAYKLVTNGNTTTNAVLR
ncbi:hypothetical protein [Brotaphodocola sp.]|uniref:hypothetical protein n=1 Tax=Brotaphodocola sp. TaxID=3073577 RepID=UPI003D7D97DF